MIQSYWIYRYLSVVILLFFIGCSADYSRVNYRTRAYYYNSSESIPIMGHGRASESQLLAFFSKTNKQFDKRYVRNVARAYIREGATEGINSDVAFCQMCVETNYLRFGGQVKKWQNNFCGLGATDGGNRGVSFKSIRLGVRAHIQHLKAYASTKSIRRKVVDPRFDRVPRGSAKYVQNLSKTWATDPQYGFKIAQKLNVLNRYIMR